MAFFSGKEHSNKKPNKTQGGAKPKNNTLADNHNTGRGLKKPYTVYFFLPKLFHKDELRSTLRITS